jgi:hypothetical protein
LDVVIAGLAIGTAAIAGLMLYGLASSGSLAPPPAFAASAAHAPAAQPGNYGNLVRLNVRF